tara:strand:+ start:155 stop:652 length:498 start_codon:yes stop_codon:yes gene_type:complete
MQDRPSGPQGEITMKKVNRQKNEKNVEYILRIIESMSDGGTIKDIRALMNSDKKNAAIKSPSSGSLSVTLNQMVKEGLIEKQKGERGLPTYHLPRQEEVIEQVERLNPSVAIVPLQSLISQTVRDMEYIAIRIQAFMDGHGTLRTLQDALGRCITVMQESQKGSE